MLSDCDQLGHKVAGKKILEKRKQSKYEGVKYKCDQCDYKSSFKQQLKIHKHSNYEGAII